MVVRDRGEDTETLVFHALADPTRRDILQRALRTGSSVSVLTQHYPMSFAAVQKHVAVLERAGLVSKQRQGREQIVHGNIDTVRHAHRLLDRFEDLWRARIGRFGDALTTPNPGEPT
ncbi:metalloregulator ArsR/SmtB family transcription factor [soil metagenome]